MLEAIKIVQPALVSFYGSPTDEQKARFNQLGTAQG
jgi:LTXXQ motif family protein